MNKSWIAPADVLLHRLDAEFYGGKYVEHERLVISKRGDPKLGLKPIGQCARLFSGPFGSKLPSNLYRDHGIPLFRVQNVYPVFPAETNLVFLDELTHAELKNSEICPKDLMLSKAGRLGDAALLPKKYQRANITEHIIGLRPGEGMDKYFLLAALNSHFVGIQFERFGIGTLINYLGVVEARSVEIPAPSKAIQEAIGNVLRQAERLRELSQCNLQSANQVLQRAGLSGLRLEDFKHGFWTSTLGPYSRLDSWPYQPRYSRAVEDLNARCSTKRLREVAALVRKRGSTEDGVTRFKYVEIGDVDTLNGTIASDCTISQSRLPSGPKFRVEEGFLLISKVRPTRGAITLVPKQLDGALATSGFAVFEPIAGREMAAYLWFAMRLPSSRWQLDQWSAGGTYPTIEDEYVCETLIPWPNEDIRQEVGVNCRRSLDQLQESEMSIGKARDHVQALLNRTLDETVLLAESAEIAGWLRANPSPYALT